MPRNCVSITLYLILVQAKSLEDLEIVGGKIFNIYKFSKIYTVINCEGYIYIYIYNVHDLDERMVQNLISNCNLIEELVLDHCKGIVTLRLIPILKILGNWKLIVIMT